MAPLTHLDTHVVVWILTGEHDRLSKRARQAVEAQPLEISPMVRLELAFLREVGKVDLDPDAAVRELTRSMDLHESTQDFAKVVRAAQKAEWTKDPFDRIIVGQALSAKAMLVTRDDTIRANYAKALW